MTPVNGCDHHPFTAPYVSPRTMCFPSTRKMTIGSMATIAVAAMELIAPIGNVAVALLLGTSGETAYSCL